MSQTHLEYNTIGNRKNIDIIDIESQDSTIINITAICTEIDFQFSTRICTDENGGAIIAWVDDRSDSGDIYV